MTDKVYVAMTAEWNEEWEVYVAHFTNRDMRVFDSYDKAFNYIQKNLLPWKVDERDIEVRKEDLEQEATDDDKVSFIYEKANGTTNGKDILWYVIKEVKIW